MDTRITSNIVNKKPGLLLNKKQPVVSEKLQGLPKESVTLGNADAGAAIYGTSAGAMLGGMIGAAGLMGGMAALSMGTLGSIMGMGMAACLAGSAAGMMAGKAAIDFTKQAHEEKAAQLRNKDGRFRTKTGKVHLETLRETYGEKFAAGLPGNMPLQVLRAATGTSLTQMVKHPEKIDPAREKLADWKAPDLAPGGRTRNADGRIHQKRGDTRLDTLRKTYGLDFAAQLPGNMPLQVLRAATGLSLSQLVANPEKIPG